MSKELQPLDDCYCAQLEANYNDAIKMSEEELDVKLNEYPEAKCMCAALVLLVEQRIRNFECGAPHVDVDDWECDTWDVIEKSICTKNQ
jgi:hypothetical protein